MFLFNRAATNTSLANQIEQMSTLKQLDTDINKFGDILANHMKQETEDRKEFIKSLSNIQMAINDIEKNVFAVKTEAHSELLSCKESLKTEIYNKVNDLMVSTKGHIDHKIEMNKLDAEGDIKEVKNLIKEHEEQHKTVLDHFRKDFDKCFDKLEKVEKKADENSKISGFVEKGIGYILLAVLVAVLGLVGLKGGF